MENVEPPKFNDELASKTQWTPISRSSASFCTHILQVDPINQSMRFACTRISTILPLVIMINSLIMPIVFFSGIIPVTIEARKTLPLLYFIIPLSSLFGATVGYLIYRSTKKFIIFDMPQQAFFISKVSPREIADITTLATYLPFQEIGGFQIIERIIESHGKNRTSYKSYEFNIVKNDSERVNVVAHGNYKQIVKDATLVADTLHKPLLLSYKCSC